jgi:hypothetical protein
VTAGRWSIAAFASRNSRESTQGALHHVVVHEVAAADVSADFFGDREASAQIAADGLDVVFVDAESDGFAAEFCAAFIDPTQGGGADTPALELWLQVKLVQKKDRLFWESLEGQVANLTKTLASIRANQVPRAIISRAMLLGSYQTVSMYSI